MTDLLDGYETSIHQYLNQLKQVIDDLNMQQQIKAQAIQKGEALVSKISGFLSSYERELISLDERKRKNFTETFKKMNSTFEPLKLQFQSKKREALTQENLFIDRKPQINSKEKMDRAQIIDHGDQIQKKEIEALKNIDIIVDEGNKLACQMDLELDDQIKQLDRLYDTVKDTQSTLKRATSIITHFAKQIYTDKFLMCLIGLIIIAIVVLIILSAMGMDNGKFNTPDQVKGSLQNISSPTTTTSNG